MDTVDRAITKPVRRLEVLTDAGRRRTVSDADKARVVAEIGTSGGSVYVVARRYGLSPQPLFGWRRQVKEARAIVPRDDEPRFVPAVVDAAPSGAAGHLQRKTPRQHRDEPSAGTIEVAIDGVTVRIDAGRVMVALRPVDFRKGADGLAALVRESMAADPFSGASTCSAPSGGSDQAGVLGWYGSVPIRQAAGTWHLPLAEAEDGVIHFGRAIVGVARRAGLAACPRGARDGEAGAAGLIAATATN